MYIRYKIYPISTGRKWKRTFQIYCIDIPMRTAWHLRIKNTKCNLYSDEQKQLHIIYYSFWKFSPPFLCVTWLTMGCACNISNIAFVCIRELFVYGQMQTWRQTHRKNRNGATKFYAYKMVRIWNAFSEFQHSRNGRFWMNKNGETVFCNFIWFVCVCVFSCLAFTHISIHSLQLVFVKFSLYFCLYIIRRFHITKQNR